MDDLIDGTIGAAEELGHVGAEVVKAGATLVGPLLVAGITVVGLGKIFEGFRD